MLFLKALWRGIALEVVRVGGLGGLVVCPDDLFGPVRVPTRQGFQEGVVLRLGLHDPGHHDTLEVVAPQPLPAREDAVGHLAQEGHARDLVGPLQIASTRTAGSCETGLEADQPR